MGFAGRIVALAVVLGAGALSPVLAQGVCPERRAILYLSNTVLTHRQSLEPEQAHRFGTEAAYLTLRYAPLEGRDGDDFVRSLLGEDMRDIRDLAFAWFVSTDGMTRAAQELGVEASEEAILSTPTTIRPLVLMNAEDVIVNAYRSKPSFERGASLARWISLALLDLSDEIKARVAAEAEEKGEILLAAMILSTMRDQQELKDLIARTSDAALLARIAAETVTNSLMVGNMPLPRDDQPITPEHKKVYEISVAVAMQPEEDYLHTFFNQTGLLDETHKAASALRAAIEEGTIRHDGTHDAAWLLAYRALLEASDDDERIKETLRSFDGFSVRANWDKIAGDIDRIIAIEALRPYLRGDTDSLPQQPEGPGGTLAADWSRWLALATLVRNSSLISDPGTDLRSLAMTAELLFAAGKADALAIMLAGSAPSGETTALAADFAKRLDRGCASYLWHLGEPFVGMPIYKFDSAGGGSGPAD